MPTGSDLFVDALQQLGIGEIFTLIGDHLNEVLSVAHRRGVSIYDMRHESGVTHAADAWARIHRRPAVSLVTGGPGHTNSLTGIATAYQACSPLIAISGAPSTALAGRQVFQSIDQVGMAAPVCKWSGQPSSAAQIPYYLGRAYQEATAGRMGPVHLTIPVNYLEGEAVTPPLALPRPAEPGRSAGPMAQIAAAMTLLESAERPLVIGGSGLWWSDAGEALHRFLERSQLGYYSVTMARGIVSDAHPLNMGYADGALNKAVHTAFKEADVVLVLGKRVDYRLALGGPRLFSPGAKFIQVDIHQQEFGQNRPIDVAVHADLRAALQEFTAWIGEFPWKSNEGWLGRQRELRDEWRGKLAAIATDAGEPLHPAAFFAEVAKALPPDTPISWDGGDFTHWGRATIPATVPGGWLRLGPLGTIGSALPNAFALKLAHPDRPIVMFTGDGSLGFYLAELDTLVRWKTPVVIFVGNDAGWGLERELQGEVQGSTVACELRATRYDQIMQGFGGAGETIRRVDQVAPALARGLAAGVPYLVNVEIRGIRSPFTDWQLGGKAKKP